MDFGFLIVHLLRERSNLLILHIEPNSKMSYQTLNNSVYYKRERGEKRENMRAQKPEMRPI